MTLLTGHSVESLEKNKLTYYKADDKEKKNSQTIISDYFLLSTRRALITQGFENLDLQIKPNGAFAVNNILVKENKANFQIQTVDYNQIPSCIYTFSEIASVGLTEEQAKK